MPLPPPRTRLIRGVMVCCTALSAVKAGRGKCAERSCPSRKGFSPIQRT
jgi:hypothetical protein